MSKHILGGATGFALASALSTIAYAQALPATPAAADAPSATDRALLALADQAETIQVPAVHITPPTSLIGPVTLAASDTTVTAPQLSLRPHNRAEDLTQEVPGLFSVQHAGGGKAQQYFLRGFDLDHGT